MAEDSVEKIKKPKGLGLRHVQALLLFLSMTTAFAMRANLSVAIVAMTEPNNHYHFKWSPQTQSMVLSSFLWGLFVLQIPAGEIATHCGGKILVTITIFVNSLMCALIPLLSKHGWQYIYALRVIQGLTQGFINPAVHTLIGKWIPPNEKSSLGTLIYTGQHVGSALQLLVSGYIADAWGWPWIFYINAIIGFAWTLAYVIIGADTPSKSWLINKEEKHYIESSVDCEERPKNRKTPWKSIWTSLPFISLIIVNCGQHWGFWTLMTELPSYMHHIMKSNIETDGVMSALPYLAMAALGCPLGFLVDHVIKKKWLSVTAVRKISNSIGHYGPAIGLITLVLAPTNNLTLAVAILICTVGCNAGTYTGYLLVHVDMAPNFAGTMMGITNFFANIFSIFALVAAGSFIKDVNNPSDWHKVFILCAMMYVIGNTIYVIFGTSKLQPWNDSPDDQNTEVAERASDAESQKGDNTSTLPLEARILEELQNKIKKKEENKVNSPESPPPEAQNAPQHTEGNTASTVNIKEEGNILQRKKSLRKSIENTAECFLV